MSKLSYLFLPLVWQANEPSQPEVAEPGPGPLAEVPPSLWRRWMTFLTRRGRGLAHSGLVSVPEYVRRDIGLARGQFWRRRQGARLAR